MRNHDERRPPGGFELEQKIENRRGIDAVEIAGRLVGKDQTGIVDNAARDGDALTFAAGKLVR